MRRNLFEVDEDPHVVGRSPRARCNPRVRVSFAHYDSLSAPLLPLARSALSANITTTARIAIQAAIDATTIQKSVGVLIALQTPHLLGQQLVTSLALSRAKRPGTSGCNSSSRRSSCADAF